MLTQRLAQFALETRNIPDNAISAARDALQDTLGCALAGSLEHTSEIVQRWVQEAGSRAAVGVWGTNLGGSPAEAAFANGIASHALDYDDSLPTLRGHPSATIIPASIAAAQVVGASGKAVLEAIAIGVEVGGILGKAFGGGHYIRGWHTTATVGAFAATAAAARLLGLSVGQLQTAWGITGSQTAGLVRNFGTMTKPFHAGNGARTAITSAQLAKAGFTACQDVFEGKTSIFDTYCGEDRAPLEPLIAKAGSPWQINDPGIFVKNWPCCYCNHRPVGGILQLIAEHGIKADEVKEIRVSFLPGSDEALIATNPQTGLEGKFSIEYSAAATIYDGKLTLDTFTDAMVQRPPVRELMKKVRRIHIQAEGIFSGVVGYNDVAIETTRGTFEVHIDKAPGSPAWPMSPEQRDEKFMDCAGRVLGQAGAAKLLEAVRGCAKAANMNDIVKFTDPGATATRGAGTKVPA